MKKYIYVNLMRKKAGDFVSYSNYGDTKNVIGRKIVWANMDREIDATIIAIVNKARGGDSFVLYPTSNDLRKKLDDRIFVSETLGRLIEERGISISCAESAAK